ncbi:MAG: carbamoyltransferase HypF [Rhodobiaceae bacterium]|nr:carbamoyltransferase HypF [Rhodobiaceae bacterium]MCC0047871.1 carbamoyltransferase HypF [Rhodobiaceae bacterium]
MTARTAERQGRRIRVRGLVQGVGFRPHVWRIATDLGLRGHVLNDGEGVDIAIWGAPGDLDAFARRLTGEAPPLARIDAIEPAALEGAEPVAGFAIVESACGRIATGVVADAATCAACLEDIGDPGNRRFGYPFTNCTHCGPRLSIVREIPYDRAKTSMSVFPMCEACRGEYENPADRRFHAQPNACPECGPRVWLEDASGEIACADPITEAAAKIRAGSIVAVKGIGGFHLACDATNADAVGALRARKHRAAKPLALMARDLGQIRRHACLRDAEIELLRSPAAPIVLLAMAGESLAPGIAPGQDHVGFMLPYTPLHHLLMARLDAPIVLTSGNLSDEPQATDNAEARERLRGIADLWLMHDRDIVNRLDDSVMRIDAPGPAVIRRARGLAPEPLLLADGFAGSPKVLAMGGELKSAFCLLSDGQAILSQHMGDLEEAATHADYRKNLDLYRSIFDFSPDVIAVDAHPDYLSTQWGEALAKETGAELIRVQHHHAHLAACLAEHRIGPEDEGGIGIILDGLGLGPDGTIWGGEVLAGGYEGYRRAAHFLPVALPGGAQAMRQPWRNTVAHLHAAFGPDWTGETAGTPFGEWLKDKPHAMMTGMIAKRLNAPLSSSAGRLFDAVAAALGICAGEQHYEGQAAMEMEALARPHLATVKPYPVIIEDTNGAQVLSWQSMWRSILDDLRRDREPGAIACAFHLGLAEALAGLAGRLAEQGAPRRAILSGGVMQNSILLETLHEGLTRRGFETLTHGRVPANDGGLALGQAAIAAACLASRSG